MTFRLSHLALLLALTTVVTAVGGVAATWWVADEEFRDILDDDLKNQSRLLAGLLTKDKVRLTAAELEELIVATFEADEEETLWVTVYDTASGRHVSNLRHDLPLDKASDGPLQRQHDGYSWQGYQEREADIVVQLLRRDDLYKEVQEEILEDIITPALVGSGTNLLLLAILIMLSLWPITRLVRQLEMRNADSLAPLTVRTPAREICVLRDSLNNLMSGVDAVLTRERQFASDVAHELRTPLTTLTLELASAEPELPVLKAEVDRLTRLVQQLLTLARLEQGKWQRRFDRLSLSDLYARVAERFADKFIAAGMMFESRIAAASAAGDPALLEILLQNLLQNVLNHCPSDTRVDLSLETTEGGIRLRVSDTGPGIAAETRRQMAQGFTRLDSKSDGFGLGLAICHRIAEVHRASVSFPARVDGASGLVVEVLFPA